MTHIRHIDEGEYSKAALSLLNDEKEGFIEFAFGNLSEGTSPSEVRESLCRRVKSKMKDRLFDHLKSTGAIEKEIRYDFHMGYPRRRYAEPRPGDVPPRLLDIDGMVPDFQEIIDSIMTEAGKRKSVADIEEVTKKARKQ